MAKGLKKLTIGKHSYKGLIIYTVILLIIAALIVIAGIFTMIEPQRAALYDYFNAQATLRGQ